MDLICQENKQFEAYSLIFFFPMVGSEDCFIIIIIYLFIFTIL